MVCPHTTVQLAPSVAPRLTSVGRYSSFRETWLRGLIDVGEHHRRPAEHVVFERDAGVDRHVVLDLDVVADHDARRHDDVLADVAATADAGARPSRAQKCQILRARRRSRSHRRRSDDSMHEVVGHAGVIMTPASSGCSGGAGVVTGVVADAMRQLDRRPALVDAEAASGEHLLVDAGMQIGEPIAELDLLRRRR